MTKILAMPYLTTAAVKTGEWNVELHGRWLPAESLLKGWDYSTGLRCESTIQASRRVVLDECGLGDDAVVVMAASWWATSTNRREIGCRRSLTHEDQLTLELEIPPGVAGGQLRLERLLLLVKPGGADDPLAAAVPGSILWREPKEAQTKITLEGDAARFPTEIVDFSTSRVADPDSLWWLERDLTDLDATPLAALRLYLNEAHPSMKKLAGDNKDDVTSALSQFLEWDVSRMLTHAALDTPEFLREWGSFRPGSLGETLEHLIRRIWPGEDGTSLAGLRSQDHGVFEARLQGRLRLLADQR